MIDPGSGSRIPPPTAAYLRRHKEMHVLRYGGTLCPEGTVENSLAGTAWVVVSWVRVPEGWLNSVRQRLDRRLRVTQGSSVSPGRVRYVTVTRQFLPGYSQQSLRDKEAARHWKPQMSSPLSPYVDAHGQLPDGEFDCPLA
jgi:hypothetical protein